MKKQATQGGRFIVKRQCTEWGGRHCFAGAGQHPPPAEPVHLQSAAKCGPVQRDVTRSAWAPVVLIGTGGEQVQHHAHGPSFRGGMQPDFSQGILG